jgi:hypothetical protein
MERMSEREIVELMIEGKDPSQEDGVNYYTFDYEELYQLARELKEKLKPSYFDHAPRGRQIDW